ncbi:unnamed protein product [Pipistrellus nathusii]|uniref:G-protein coupled receptors family 1 profile domain-containing protein n=1 Tax=Pipistrellus nathusii TaxID=59473 RepID=A0ABP0AGV7_PIPNA
MSVWGNDSSSLSYTSFLLLGFPGLQEARTLLVLPFLSLYLAIVSTNALVIHTVAAQRRLHQPVYLLIALLLAVNICAASAVLPPMLFSFSARFSRVSLARCLAQMFCIYFLIAFDCNILLVMALDRYVAICNPLRYPQVVTGRLLACLVGAAAARSTGIVAPVVGLASRVRFCRSDVIHHFACEHMALMKLSCSGAHCPHLQPSPGHAAARRLLLPHPPRRVPPFAGQGTRQGPGHLWLPPAGHLHRLLLHHVLVHRLPRGPHRLPGCAQPAQRLLPTAPLSDQPHHLRGQDQGNRQHLGLLFRKARLQVPAGKAQSLPSHRELPA